jgi:hypothetical protein
MHEKGKEIKPERKAKARQQEIRDEPTLNR